MDNFKHHSIVAALLLLVFGTGVSMSCPLDDFGKKGSTAVKGHIPPTTNTDFEWGSEVRAHGDGSRAWHYVKNEHQDPISFTWPKAEMLVPFDAPLLRGRSACEYGYGDANGYTIDRDAPIIPSRDGIKNAEVFVRTGGESTTNTGGKSRTNTSGKSRTNTDGKSRTNGAALERDDVQNGTVISRFAKLIFNYSASDKDLKINVDSGPDHTPMAFRPEAVGISQADFLTELRNEKVEYKGFFPLHQLATANQVGSMDLNMDQSYILMTPGREYTLEFREFTLQPSGFTPLLLFSPNGALIAATRINTNLLLDLSPPTTWVQEEVRQLPTQTVTLSGTVATIDHQKRTVNIKKVDGSFETVDVPPSAKRFDELKAGDKVSITYNNNVSARLKPPGEAPVDTQTGTSTAGQEARPGGTAAVQRTMTATIDAIDKNASSITFVGLNGWKYSRHIVDPTVLDKVKVGDKVDITWNAGASVAVQ